jgi:hypothetical protein
MLLLIDDQDMAVAAIRRMPLAASITSRPSGSAIFLAMASAMRCLPVKPREPVRRIFVGLVILESD